jgi:hypothetical protein
VDIDARKHRVNFILTSLIGPTYPTHYNAQNKWQILDVQRNIVTLSSYQHNLKNHAFFQSYFCCMYANTSCSPKNCNAFHYFRLRDKPHTSTSTKPPSHAPSLLIGIIEYQVSNYSIVVNYLTIRKKNRKNIFPSPFVHYTPPIKLNDFYKLIYSAHTFTTFATTQSLDLHSMTASTSKSTPAKRKG